MSVKQCLECGGVVEVNELDCPHCGTRQSRSGGRNVAVIVAIILVPALAYLAYKYIAPKFAKSPLNAGEPAVTVEDTPACATMDLLESYQKHAARGNKDDLEKLLKFGCFKAKEGVPVSILKVNSNGKALVQGFAGDRGTNFWVSLTDLKPYKSK